MLKPLLNRLASLAAGFYAWGPDQVVKICKFSGLAQFSSWLSRRLSKRFAVLSIELFVALSLAVNFYLLVRPAVLPRPDGSLMNKFMFSYLSEHVDPGARDLVQLSWKKRLAGPMLSGWLLDTKINGNGNFNDVDFQNVFGFYNAAWLFLLFLILILHRKDALLIILGVFAGLMYNLTDPKNGALYYPWDMPTVFFFTWAFLLYDSRRIWLLMLVVWCGGLFKETNLCCALLILFGEQWTLKKRVAGFAATVGAVFITVRVLMAHYDIKAPALAMNNATNLIDLVWHSLLPSNIQILFNSDVRHVLFGNAGSILIILLLPWRNRRDILFKLLIVFYVIGQFFYGIVSEVRIWYEALPLGWMLISETLSRNHPTVPESQAGQNTPATGGPKLKRTVAANVHSAGAGQGVAQPGSNRDDRMGRVLGGSYWLMICLLLALALVVRILAH